MAQNRREKGKKFGLNTGPRFDNDQLGENKTDPGMSATADARSGKKSSR